MGGNKVAPPKKAGTGTAGLGQPVQEGRVYQGKENQGGQIKSSYG